MEEVLGVRVGNRTVFHTTRHIASFWVTIR
jgi:hypothetical protein